MTDRLISKPDYGDVIGATEKGDKVVVTPVFQNFLDDIEQKTNEALLGQSGPTLPSYTVATLPTVGTAGLIYVSDEIGGATLAFSNGTNWLRVQDRAIVT